MERERPHRAGERASGEDRLSLALRTLEDGIGALVEDAAFADYLRAMSRFHQYSFGNVMLILSQRPEATHVAGYRTWQALGRQVRKGERGITILVPRTRAVELDEGEESRIVTGFGTGSVFDIAQTDGDPLPQPPAVRALEASTDAGAALYEALETYLTNQGITVSREELARGNGYYQPGTRRIAVDTRLTGDQATKTLAHEAAHAVAAHRGGLARADAETVAESSAFVVLAHYGIDTSGYTFSYVAGWAEQREVLTRNLGAIQTTSHAIISGLEQQALAQEGGPQTGRGEGR